MLGGNSQPRQQNKRKHNLEPLCVYCNHELLLKVQLINTSINQCGSYVTLVIISKDYYTNWSLWSSVKACKPDIWELVSFWYVQLSKFTEMKPWTSKQLHTFQFLVEILCSTKFCLICCFSISLVNTILTDVSVFKACLSS